MFRDQYDGQACRHTSRKVRCGLSRRRSAAERSYLANIAHLDMALVASPIFVAQWGLVEDVRRLQKLPFARYTMAGRHYPIRFVNGTEIVPEGRVDLDSASAIREAVISGVGAGHLVRRLVQEDIDQGRIIELLPSMKLQTVPLQAIHVSGNMPPHRLTLLVNFVAGAMRRA
ncbi:hypothetical protein GOC73_28430 [Sinorhizobium medicae]|nr:hypothetical protein [Sinorhizobium medicae]MDX0691806.1 hypothetical protein [Sinorhizobium medicae]